MILVAAVFSHIADAGTLRKIWDFKVDAVPGADSAAGPHQVYAIGFSRDGDKVAALVGRSDHEQWVVVLDSHIRQPFP